MFSTENVRDMRYASFLCTYLQLVLIDGLTLKCNILHTV